MPTSYIFDTYQSVLMCAPMRMYILHMYYIPTDSLTPYILRICSSLHKACTPVVPKSTAGNLYHSFIAYLSLLIAYPYAVCLHTRHQPRFAAQTLPVTFGLLLGTLQPTPPTCGTGGAEFCVDRCSYMCIFMYTSRVFQHMSVYVSALDMTVYGFKREHTKKMYR